MRSLWCSGLVTAAMVVGLTETASAQARPGTSGSLTGGSTGGFTGGSMFSSGSSGLGGNSGGLGGQSGLGGGLGGQSGLGGGQSGLGGGLGGQSGLGGGQQGGLGGSNPFGQQNSGFIGRNGGNTFIGANAGQTQNGLNGQNRQSARGQRGQAQQQNQFNQNNGGGGEANRNLGVRPRQKVAFTHPVLETPKVVGKIEAHFQKLASRHTHLSAVKLNAEADGTVVLTGEAKSLADAKMAESLVRLEPGVRGVRNEMTYPPPVDEVQ